MSEETNQTNKGNKPVNNGKCIQTENDNFMVSKGGFFFFMDAMGNHLDEYEKRTGKLHLSQKWAELKSQKDPQEMTPVMIEHANKIINDILAPMKEKIGFQQRTAFINQNHGANGSYYAKPLTQRPFADLNKKLG